MESSERIVSLQSTRDSVATIVCQVIVRSVDPIGSHN